MRYVSTFALLDNTERSTLFGQPRGMNVLDGGAPFYDVYTCKDGGWITVACIEQRFFQAFLDHFLDALPSDFALSDGWRPSLSSHNDRTAWPRLRRFMEAGFRLHTRDHWTDVFHGESNSSLDLSYAIIPVLRIGTDSCTVPILSPPEAGHLLASIDPLAPSPDAHPILSRTPSNVTRNRQAQITHIQPGQHNINVLTELGLTVEDIQQLARDGAMGKKSSKL